MNKRKRVLIACEYSAVVRDAFRELGHDAWSVDLLPTEGDPRFHIQGDALTAVYDSWRNPWDLVIAHPPCTRLCVAGVRWLHERDLWGEMETAARFFREFLTLPVEQIAVENPIMHRYAAEIVGRKQDQLIQPYMFGHRESKRTGLWLKNLPLLVPTDDVKAETMALTAKERDRVHWMAPGPDRWKERSRTLAGVAKAMAVQWG